MAPGEPVAELGPGARRPATAFAAIRFTGSVSPARLEEAGGAQRARARSRWRTPARRASGPALQRRGADVHHRRLPSSPPSAGGGGRRARRRSRSPRATVSSVSASTLSAPGPQARCRPCRRARRCGRRRGPPSRRRCPGPPAITSSPGAARRPRRCPRRRSPRRRALPPQPVGARTAQQRRPARAARPPPCPRDRPGRSAPDGRRPSGQKVWTMKPFASTSPGVQLPGSIPPSTRSSRNSTRLPRRPHRQAVERGGVGGDVRDQPAARAHQRVGRGGRRHQGQRRRSDRAPRTSRLTAGTPRSIRVRRRSVCRIVPSLKAMYSSSVPCGSRA